MANKCQNPIENDDWFKNLSFSWLQDYPKAIPPVKDQGETYNCYVFHSLEATESKYFLDKKLEEPILLSRQEVVDCCHTSLGIEKKQKDLHGCYAAPASAAFDYMMQYGLVEEKFYPYTGTREAEPCVPSTIINAKQKLFINGYGLALLGKSIKTMSEEHEGTHGPRRVLSPMSLIKLIRSQPLVGLITHVFPSFSAYKGEGIYEGPTSLEDDIMDADMTAPGHVVLVVGFGFEGEKLYLLIKNSGSKSWGHEGFGKVALDVFEGFLFPIGPHFSDVVFRSS